MSLADDAKLLLIPTGYKASKVYSVFPTDGDGDFTYTRSGDASRVNPGGLIETVGTNIPRIDHTGGGCPKLLLEPQRTNNLKYSEDLTNAVWSLLSAGTGVNPIVTSNYSIAPNGTLTADRIIFNQGSGTSGSDYSIIRQLITSVGQGVSSVYMKSNTDENYIIGIDEVGLGTKNVTVTSDWQRFDYSETTNDRLQLSLRGSTNSNYADISVWGAMMEAGTYPTSYIKTEASTVTRLVDRCEVASGLENIINQTEGVFYIEFEYLYETTTDSSTDANRDILVMGTASDISEGISIDNFRSQFRVFIQGSGMTTQSVGNNTAGSSQPNTRYKLAVNYKSGDNKAYLNGSLLGSVQTGNVSFVTDLDGIFFSYNSGSRPFKNQKKVYDLRVYDTALTDNELIELTTL